MIDLPQKTLVHKKLPKTAFYKNLKLSGKLKNQFIADIKEIFVENDLTNDSLNFTTESDVKEILVVKIVLKSPNITPKILEEIVKHNDHNLIFYLVCNDSCQLAVYKGKLYESGWKKEKDLTLKAIGLNLDEVWDNMIVQAALNEERRNRPEELSLNERLKLQDRIIKLEKETEKLKRKVDIEVQPKKKFNYHTEYKKKLKELEELIDGKA